MVKKIRIIIIDQSDRSENEWMCYTVPVDQLLAIRASTALRYILTYGCTYVRYPYQSSFFTFFQSIGWCRAVGSGTLFSARFQETVKTSHIKRLTSDY